MTDYIVRYCTDEKPDVAGACCEKLDRIEGMYSGTQRLYAASSFRRFTNKQTNTHTHTHTHTNHQYNNRRLNK